MKQNVIFITGTDTGVGKTVICGCLARYFQEKGLRVITQKWVSTGSAAFPQDIDVHLKLMGKRRAEFKNYLSSMAPFSFRFASSPHLAARLEGKRISLTRIKRNLQTLRKDFDLVIVEGAGGLVVPLTRKKVIADLVKELALPVLVVAANRLGAINHTLLTVEILKGRGIEILGIVFNNLGRERKIIRKDNLRIVHELGKTKVLGEMPRVVDLRRIYRAFRRIGDRLWPIVKRKLVAHGS